MFVWHHHSLPITQYFSHNLWAPYLSPGVAFLFSFFSFFLVPKLTKPKKELNSQPRRRKEKKKVKMWSKGAAEYCLWVPYVYLITILPLSYEL